MQAIELQASLYERIPLSRATKSVLDRNSERIGELEGGFAVIPA
jgi:hypothetical protein